MIALTRKPEIRQHLLLWLIVLADNRVLPHIRWQARSIGIIVQAATSLFIKIPSLLADLDDATDRHRFNNLCFCTSSVAS